MSEPQPVDGTPDDAAGDDGEQDVTLTTDDEAQDSGDVVKPGNS